MLYVVLICWGHRTKPDSVDYGSKGKGDMLKKSGSSSVAMASMRTEAFNHAVLTNATVYVRAK